MPQALRLNNLKVKNFFRDKMNKKKKGKKKRKKGV